MGHFRCIVRFVSSLTTIPRFLKMERHTWSEGDHRRSLVLSPQEALVAGGAAEAFERHLQQLFRGGQRNLVIDLSEVPSLDSAGIRALVRGHTSAQRLGGSFRLATPKPAVAKVLELSHLGGVFDMYDSVEGARMAAWPWRTIRVWAAIIVLCGSLVAVGIRWPTELSGLVDPTGALVPELGVPPSRLVPPFLELLKLLAAALIGVVVTAIHKPEPRERSLARSMVQAQTLLCVSGAMVMIIIGNNVARAFGIAGAASIIRFRTPVDDPKDVTILFLLMGLGMAAGLGFFAVAGLATAFLCVALLVLDRMAEEQTRLMSVEIQARGRQFPAPHVEGIFARNQVVFEPREISQGKNVSVRYHTWLDPRASLDDLSAQLMGEDAGVESVSWEHPKRA